MSQHDMDLANQAGAAFRADANNALLALVSNSSGTTEPSVKFAYMWWADTTTGLLKIRNAANNAWITVGLLASAGFSIIDAAGDLIYGTAADTAGRLPIGTARQALRVNAAGTTPEWAALITLGTEQPATSGVALDFTGIPSGVRRITIMFKGVSTSGTSAIIVQLGDAGGPENSGYLGACSTINSVVATDAMTTGFGFVRGPDPSSLVHGSMTLSLESAAAFSWTMASSGSISTGTVSSLVGSGSKSLSAELTQIRITTVNGTDAFDAGGINISYE